MHLNYVGDCLGGMGMDGMDAAAAWEGAWLSGAEVSAVTEGQTAANRQPPATRRPPARINL